MHASLKILKKALIKWFTILTFTKYYSNTKKNQ